jgi:hypothetical protein
MSRGVCISAPLVFISVPLGVHVFKNNMFCKITEFPEFPEFLKFPEFPEFSE